MEELAISLIKDGGVSAVLFVLWLVSFLWCYMKIKEQQDRLNDSHSEVENVKKDREATKADRDTKIALLEQRCQILEKRLEDGNSRFDNLDAEIKSMNVKFDGKMEKMNEKLVAVITKIDTLIGIKLKSHTPEDGPV